MSFAVSVEPLAMRAPESCRAPSAPEAFVQERLTAIRRTLGNPAVLARTLETLRRLSTNDPEMPVLEAWLAQGISCADRRFELRSALRALAEVIAPRTFLEIGTGRGWALAQVAAESPDVRVYSIDLWAPEPEGIANPGPESAHGEVERAAPEFRGKITYIDGNSHDVLPVFLDGCFDPMTYPDELMLVRESENRPRRFDLIAIDGDRTALGTWWDLNDLLPRVALGGALVFADLRDRSGETAGVHAQCLKPPRVPTPPDLKASLLDVWRRMPAIFPDFAFLEHEGGGFSAGVAVRVR